jgi:hypothetical protein
MAEISIDQSKLPGVKEGRVLAGARRPPPSSPARGAGLAPGTPQPAPGLCWPGLNPERPGLRLHCGILG